MTFHANCLRDNLHEMSVFCLKLQETEILRTVIILQMCVMLFQIFIRNIPRKIFIFCDSISSHLEPPSDCDFGLVTSQDLDCSQQHWFLVVDKGL